MPFEISNGLMLCLVESLKTKVNFFNIYNIFVTIFFRMTFLFISSVSQPYFAHPPLLTMYSDARTSQKGRFLSV